MIAAETPDLRAAYLFRVRAVRMFTAYVESAAVLGAAAGGGADAAAHRRRAAAIRRDIVDDGGNLAPAALIAGELAVLDGDLEAARAHYRSAAEGFAATAMRLIAIATRWRLGEVEGGSAGAALCADAEAAMRAEGIADPARVVSLFVPVAAPAV
jgi:hypothetical protein